MNRTFTLRSWPSLFTEGEGLGAGPGASGGRGASAPPPQQVLLHGLPSVSVPWKEWSLSRTSGPREDGAPPPPSPAPPRPPLRFPPPFLQPPTLQISDVHRPFRSLGWGALGQLSEGGPGEGPGSDASQTPRSEFLTTAPRAHPVWRGSRQRAGSTLGLAVAQVGRGSWGLDVPGISASWGAGRGWVPWGWAPHQSQPNDNSYRLGFGPPSACSNGISNPGSPASRPGSPHVRMDTSPPSTGACARLRPSEAALKQTPWAPSHRSTVGHPLPGGLRWALGHGDRWTPAPSPSLFPVL